VAAAEFVWIVPANHPALAGHFPGQPIVPGALLLDRAIAFAATLAGAGTGSWRINTAKFLAPAGPGAELVFAYSAAAGGALNFTVRAAGGIVASGSLTPPGP
jgi:3-hydroxymyristoyl/3-hydroxydecanoyl-(acyl carrier protein) dehydratase